MACPGIAPSVPGVKSGLARLSSGTGFRTVCAGRRPRRQFRPRQATAVAGHHRRGTSQTRVRKMQQRQPATAPDQPAISGRSSRPQGARQQRAQQVLQQSVSFPEERTPSAPLRRTAGPCARPRCRGGPARHGLSSARPRSALVPAFRFPAAACRRAVLTMNVPEALPVQLPETHARESGPASLSRSPSPHGVGGGRTAPKGTGRDAQAALAGIRARRYASRARRCGAGLPPRPPAARQERPLLPGRGEAVP